MARDERTARMLLSILVEPDEPITGSILARFEAMELLQLADSHAAIPRLGQVKTEVWRSHFQRHDVQQLATQLGEARESGIAVLIPDDKD